MNLMKVLSFLLAFSVITFADSSKYSFERINLKNDLCSVCFSYLEVDYPLPSQKDPVSKGVRKYILTHLGQPKSVAMDESSLKKIFNQWDACGFKAHGNCDAVKKEELDDFCLEESELPAVCRYERTFKFTYSRQSKDIVYFNMVTVDYNAGAAHGNVRDIGEVLFDIKTGKNLTQNDIFINKLDEATQKKFLKMSKFDVDYPDDVLDEDFFFNDAYPENGILVTTWRTYVGGSASYNSDPEKGTIPFEKIEHLIRPEAKKYFKK